MSIYGATLSVCIILAGMDKISGNTGFSFIKVLFIISPTWNIL